MQTDHLTYQAVVLAQHNGPLSPGKDHSITTENENDADERDEDIFAGNSLQEQEGQDSLQGTGGNKPGKQPVAE